MTTLVEGPDGSSPLPLEPFLEKVQATRITPNFATFIGQGTVRSAVMGAVDRPATPGELDRMRALVALISHMRNEADGLLDSVGETIAIGERGGLPTQLTHHKVIGRKYWGASVDTLRMVDEARARGVDATIDQYPYTASATSIGAALLPQWVQEGGRDAMLARLKDPATRAKAKASSVILIRDVRGGGDPRNVSMSACAFDPRLAGRNLADVTTGRGLEPTLEYAAETAMWIVEQGGCSGIFHAIGEEDLERILVHPATMIASDGEVTTFGRDVPHPRSYGTFARVLGRYVRDRKLLPLEVAVQKMSAFPAQRLGLTDRGVLRTGLRADIVVFNPTTVCDTATFEQPHSYAEGVSIVVVNGQVAFEDGTMTTARPGRVLYGSGMGRTQPSSLASR